MVPPIPSLPFATKYAESDGVNIAYRTYGDGPLGLIYFPGLISHIEIIHRSEASGLGVEVIDCRGRAAYGRALRCRFG